MLLLHTKYNTLLILYDLIVTWHKRRCASYVMIRLRTRMHEYLMHRHFIAIIQLD